MATDVLDGSQLSAALRAGIYRVTSREEIINKINVFPVPDGDTGTNLALTLQSVLACLRDNPDEHAGRTLVRVADAALDGARGNSGAIFAQFLLGVGDRVGHLPSISVRDFSDAVSGGASYAREAMSDPREGTILTVLSDFARSVQQAVTRGSTGAFPALFSETLVIARQSLEATRTQLESLRRANVVDAGAMGFVELLAGMSEFLHTGQVDDANAPTPVHEEGMAAGETQDLAHRYCTECMITGEGIDRRQLREALSVLGSSLVVAGTHRKVKVHLHLNEPQQLFELASRFGEVSGHKADDMHRQQEAAHHVSRRKVAILTDSGADLPDSLLEQFDIHMVPARLSFGSQSFLDKVSLTPEQFFHELATNPSHPKTSLPPPGDFRRAFEFLGSHYESVVYVGLTAQVSGTFQSGEAGAARANTHARIIAVDSSNVSLGQGLVAIRAAEAAAEGLDASAVEQAALKARAETRTWACLETLDYAVRGGRVPGWLRTLADWLHITPLLAVHANGSIGLGGILLGRKRMFGKFSEFVSRKLPRGKRWRVAVAHANSADVGQAVLHAITVGRNDIEAWPLIPLGTAFGVHGGPGCIVVSVQECHEA